MKVTATPYHSATSSPTNPKEGTGSLARTFGNGFLFGVPVGDFGWFASLLIGFATGFAAFFAATFVGIVTLLIYNTGGHHTANYAWAYTRFGLPAGITCGVLALTYMAVLWGKRKSRGMVRKNG